MTPGVAGPSFAALLGAGPWALDGGLASELEARGHDLSGALWSARLLRDDPRAIVDVHRAYAEAGAVVAISASYQASRAGFAAAGLEPAEADVLLARSVALAREAADETTSTREGRPLLVAASVGPYGAIRHDGSEYRGRYGLSRRALVAFHRERLDVLVAAGPDLLAVETVPDLDEVGALVEVLADHPGVPAWIALSCADGEHVNAGQTVRETAAVAASAPSVLALGVNCTPPEHVAGVLAGLAAGAADAGRPGLALLAYPNAGRTWDAAAECWLGEGASTLPDAVVDGWLDAGARLVGGCCGLGPDAVRAVAAVTARRRP